jgi:hypothetical protein
LASRPAPSFRCLRKNQWRRSTTDTGYPAPAAYDQWLDPASTIERLKPLLREHNLDGQLQFYRVGREINSSRIQGDASCIAPVDSL